MIDYSVISLNELLSHENIDEEKLVNSFRKFSCSKEKDLEDFLVKSAIHYELIEFGKTFLIIDNEELKNGHLEIAAFFTIGQVSVDISNLSQKQKKKLLGSVPGRDRMTSFPAFLIGQLGRNDKYNKIQLPGSVIIEECRSRLEAAQIIVGGKLVILECREALQAFYTAQHFKKLSEINDKGLYTYYKRLDTW